MNLENIIVPWGAQQPRLTFLVLQLREALAYRIQKLGNIQVQRATFFMIPPFENIWKKKKKKTSEVLMDSVLQVCPLL